MKFTISYYGNTATARTSAGAIKAAKRIVRTYGEANRNPVIDCDSEAAADDLVKMQQIARTSYPVQVAGVAVI